MSCIVNVLNDENVLSDIAFGLEFRFDLKFASGIGSFVRLGPDELIGVLMAYKFDEIRIEHECSFEYTNNHKFCFSLFFEDSFVVLVDLLCQFADDLLDVLSTVQ
jgi:hypothetical protein